MVIPHCSVTAYLTFSPEIQTASPPLWQYGEPVLLGWLEIFIPSKICFLTALSLIKIKIVLKFISVLDHSKGDFLLK